jgi:hypothetical protein
MATVLSLNSLEDVGADKNNNHVDDMLTENSF